MAKNWFTMKHHGFGWVPISIEGWAVILGFIGYLWYIFNGIEKGVDAFPTTKFIIGIAVLIFIMYSKGPSPRWRWDRN